MAQQNAYIIGALYPLNGGYGGFWKQPGGPNSPVFPEQETGNSNLFSTVPFNEKTAQFIGVCGHSFVSCMIWREYDYENNVSVALLSCPSCGCVNRTVSPFEDALITGVGLGELILFP